MEIIRPHECVSLVWCPPHTPVFTVLEVRLGLKNKNKLSLSMKNIRYSFWQIGKYHKMLAYFSLELHSSKFVVYKLFTSMSVYDTIL